MSSRTIVTKFDVMDVAYILSEARDKGVLSRGYIKQIEVDVGSDGSRQARIWYKLDNNAVFAPSGGLWEEYELGTESEARTLASNYHRIHARYHLDKADTYQQ